MLKHRRVLLIPVLAVAALVVEVDNVSAGWFFHRRTAAQGGEQDRAACCLRPAEPPRGRVAVSIPGQLDLQSLDQLEAQSADDTVSTLEADLTRLTIIVENMVEKQQQMETDLSRLTILVEQLVESQLNE